MLPSGDQAVNQGETSVEKARTISPETGSTTRTSQLSDSPPEQKPRLRKPLSSKSGPKPSMFLTLWRFSTDHTSTPRPTLPKARSAPSALNVMIGRSLTLPFPISVALPLVRSQTVTGGSVSR